MEEAGQRAPSHSDILEVTTSTYRCLFCLNAKKGSGNVIFCTGCHYHLCENCWEGHPPHRPELGLQGAEGVPHEKVDPKIVDALQQCMAEPKDDADQHEQHQNDDDTTWFGLERDLTEGEPVLAEYKRYSSLMMQYSSIESQDRYPALVSFIGQTGTRSLYNW